MKQLLKNNWLFYSSYLVVIIITAMYLLAYDKITLHQKINSVVGNPIADNFFKYFTNVGDGLLAILIGIVLLFFNIRNGMYVLASHFISGSISSVCKNYLFNYTRPFFTFDYYHREIKIKYIEGVDYIGQFSFPSGHATTAFTVFTCLALMTSNKLLKIIFLLIASMAAYSRIYISQHWLIDIFAGSIIGITIATAMYFVFINSNSLSNKLNRPLIQSKI